MSVEKQFELKGLSHLALVCSDMARTVDFYEGVLGIPLTKTMELPNGLGQHFFFDVGNGDCLAFFYFADGKPAAPGIAGPADLFSPSADGSMHHVAFKIAAEKVPEYHARLTEKGVDFLFTAHHLARPSGHELRDIAEDTYAASFYFKDPDGMVIEFCAWIEAGWERVVREHEPLHGTRAAVSA